MWKVLSRALGIKPWPAVAVRGQAFAAPIAVRRNAPDEAVALLFSTVESVLDDPIFVSRCQWRLQELLYDGTEPTNAAETATRDRFRQMGISPTLPRAYHLSNAFAHQTPLYVADVALPADGSVLDFSDHDSLPRVRFDMSGAQQVAELIAEPSAPTAVARRRLESMLTRGARFVWAELAQANYQLYQPGTRSAACMVMFSFDYTVTAEEMRAWCARLHPLKFTKPADPVVREAVWPLEADDQSWYYHRRFPLPLAFTGRREVFLADLWAHRPFIDGRFLSRDELGDRPRRVPLLAEKKQTGWAGIELVPFNEASTYQARAGGRDT